MITIIPAIDMIGGKCVRLTKGDYSTKKVYADSPVDMAKEFEAHGIKRLHLVDLDGAKAGSPVNLKILEQICNETALDVDFGGGVRNTQNLKDVINCGAQQITAGSIAVKNKPLVLEWLNEYGADRIILGADTQDGFISIDAWQEKSTMSFDKYLADYVSEGFTHTICTDVSKDGALAGPAFDLYERIKKNHPELYLIASGGMSEASELDRLVELNVDAVIIGKAIYEGRITMKELEPFLC